MAGRPKALTWLSKPHSVGKAWLPGYWTSTAAVLFLCMFCATALTVDYAADAGLLLLATVGMYAGFRRGFITDLRTAEKLLLLAFALYPTAAIVSYLAGAQTDMGFRLLGRDLRFFLFIPVYLALRWSFPRREAVGWGLAAGACGASISAVIAVLGHGAGFRAQGVTGVSIAFGDLSLVSGFLGASLLLGVRRRYARFGACISVAAGLAASTLSGSRGGWIAVPILALVLVYETDTAGIRRFAASLALISVAAIAVLAAIPGTPVATRGREALRQLSLYLEHARSGHAPAADLVAVCPNDRAFLANLAEGIKQWSRGAPIRIRIVRAPALFEGSPWKTRCRSDYMFEVSKSARSRGWTTLVIPRSVASGGRQQVGILAAGSAMLRSAHADRHLRFESSGLKEIVANLYLPDYQPLLVSLLPGDSLRFVPLQLTPGSYYYFYTANPVGLRMEMWLAAGKMFVKHPILGTGTGAFSESARRMIANGRIAPGVAAFDHPHNDYMAALGQQGIVGFAVLLGLFLTPLLAARRRDGRRSGTSLLLLPAGWMVFSLTETLFVHSLVITWYIVVTAGLVAASNAPEETPAAASDNVP